MGPGRGSGVGDWGTPARYLEQAERGYFVKLEFPAIFILAATSLVACSEKTGAIDTRILSSMREQPEIVAIHYSPAPFSATTPEVRNAASAATLFGAVGGAVAAAIQAREAEQAGSEVVRDYNLQDPMLTIMHGFLERVVSNSTSPHVRQLQEAIAREHIDDLKREFYHGYIFDFKTTAWSMKQSGPLSPNHYRAYYTGRVRLLHFPEGKTEWQGTCEAEGKIENSAPTLLQLVSNSAAILKTQLDGISEACIDQLEQQFTTKP